MAQATDANDATVQQPLPLRLSRVFHAPRETVFKAWSSAEHVKRWFSPETFTVPDAKVQMHVGGPFDVCMRSPTGEEHWTRGTFVEVSAAHPAGDRHGLHRQHRHGSCSAPIPRSISPTRSAGRAWTWCRATRSIDPSMAWMVTGAPDGWRTTLDKLEKEVVRMQGGTETGVRSVVHATFHLERTYDAPVARVWKALTDETAKRSGSAARREAGNCSSGTWTCAWAARERLKGRWEGGVVSTFDATYHDVVAERAAGLQLRDASG